MINISDFFMTFVSLAALVTLLTGWVNTTFIKSDSKLFGIIELKQLTAWVVAIIICSVGQMKSLGYFAEMDSLQTILTGFGLGLVSNGIADIQIVRSILEFLRARPSNNV